MRLYRYRKDLGRSDLYVLHHIRKGFRKMIEANRLQVMFAGECFEQLKLPAWRRVSPLRYELGTVKWRPVHITVIRNCDVKKIAEYLSFPKTNILNTLFSFSALPVAAAEQSGDIQKFKPDFVYKNIVCYAVVTQTVFR